MELMGETASRASASRSRGRSLRSSSCPRSSGAGVRLMGKADAGGGGPSRAEGPPKIQAIAAGNRATVPGAALIRPSKALLTTSTLMGRHGGDQRRSVCLRGSERVSE